VVTPLTKPYHDAAHSRAVAERFRRYLAAAGAGEALQKVGFLAGLLYDAGHPGERYREDAPDVDHPELSNEEYAAALAVERLQAVLNTSQLAWIYGVIAATSFGQKPGKDPAVNAVLKAREHLVRPYGPVTPHQLLLHFADINSTGGSAGFEEFMARGAKLRREMARGAQLTWHWSDRLGYARSQAGFLSYIMMIAENAVRHFSESGFAESVIRDLAVVKERVEQVVSVWTAENCISLNE
jgi:hypothetical protein